MKFQDAQKLAAFANAENKINAVIAGVSLCDSEHGGLSSFVTLDYGIGGCQGFGGWMLYMPNKSRDIGGMWVWRVMEIAGVSEWASVKGQPVRVHSDFNGVHGIGHIINDDWFVPALEIAQGKL